MALLLSVLSALQYGVADFSGGFATRRNAVFPVVVLSQLIGLALALVAAPIVSVAVPGRVDLLWGAVAGLAGAAGVTLLYIALATSVVAIASPAAALTGALLPVLFGVFLGERVSVTTWIGVGCVLPAIVALTAQPAGTVRVVTAGHKGRALGMGVTAGVCFGLFFICISRTTAASGLWPLVAARTASIAVLAPAAIRTGRIRDRRRGSVAALAAAGILDMGANISLLLALRLGSIITVTLVTSVYPAPTVALARFVFREPIAPVRWAGLVLAIIGVALMGAG